MREVYRREARAGDRGRIADGGWTETLNPIAVVPAKAGTPRLMLGGTGNDRFECSVFGRRAIRGHAIDLIDRDSVDSALTVRWRADQTRAVPRFGV